MEALFVLWMLAYALLMLVFAAVNSRPISYQTNNIESPADTVDVIVPYRNEVGCLTLLLEGLRDQENAGSFRLIMVDDHSEDEGSAVLERLANAWEQGSLFSFHLPEGKYGKKAALALGAGHSTADIILFTDADTRLPRRWIASYRQAFTEQKDVCLWCGPVMVEPGSRFSGLIQFLEYGSLMLAGRAALALGWPMLASGASMGIRREALESLGPDPWNDALSSGDDVFLLRRVWEVYGKKAASFLWYRSVLVGVAPESGWKAMIRQRARWAGKSAKMKGAGIRLTGGLTAGANILLAGAVLATLGGWLHATTFLIGFGIKAAAELALALSWARLTKRWWPVLAAPLVSLVYPFLFLAVAFTAIWKNTTWKGRRISRSIDQ